MKRGKPAKKAQNKFYKETEASPKTSAKFEDTLFSQYADSETNISPEGLSKLCKDIGLDMNNDVVSWITYSLRYLLSSINVKARNTVR